MKRLYIIGGLLAGLLILTVLTALAVEMRPVHKFKHDGTCVPHEVPVHAEANGWIEGPCPDEADTPTPVPQEPTPTPTPVPAQPTATPVPQEPTPTETPAPGQPTATPVPQEPIATPVPQEPTPTQTATRSTSGSSGSQGLIVDPPTDPVCWPLCCPLDPSEVALNLAKAALLEAITDQVKQGNMPAIQIDMQ